MEKRKHGTYLFFYLKTGGGHLAPAKSLAQYINTNGNQQIKPVLVDGLKESRRWVKYILEDGYRISQNKAPWVFEALYALNKLPIVAKATAALVSRFVEPFLKKQIEQQQPEKIVIFHFFLIKPIKRILKKLKLETPTLTVVTDPYTAHPIWFLDRKEKFIVFSKQLKQKLATKLPEENLRVFPFILNEKFNAPLTDRQKREFTQELGLSPTKKTILILGGADGIPKGKSILKSLLKAKLNAQVAIVCGHNKELYDKANGWKEKYNAHNLFVFGFVDFVHQLINISDVVISKCGASTFLEILMTKKLPIINNYLWEQEKGNVEFVTKNQLGFYEKKIKKLPPLITGIINENPLVKNINKNLCELKIENGVSKVSNYIINYS